MSTLPKYEDLPDPRRYWPAPANSYEEGLGMLRLLTPEIVANAARNEIQTGERVCLNWELEKLDPPGFGRRRFQHLIKIVECSNGAALDDEYHFNPQQSSQWDGLRHHSAPWPDHKREEKKLWYGGTTLEEIIETDSPRIGIGHWAKKGIAGRGVLIDYASWAEKHKGLKPDYALTRHRISLDDVLAIAKESKIEFQHGDILFLRVGLPQTWNAMSETQRKEYSEQQMPSHAGIEQSERVVKWLWNSHFAVVASDAVSFEVFPPMENDWDLHHHLLAGWGVPIGEMFDLDGLAELCKQHNRWTFFVSSSPLNCGRGVSSPPNCMAIF
ncbi:hypothetical protein BGW36DRAFT_335165 [Talaromyces proteolyticus]|uniref:Cyclase n=1 Tax=Talaromyces proteolyticus TaxID=1131652 RepID=A0AAD4L1X7_9EURO|nr:uncharacterized protein BGW36DRAFT_335165 [Talaromyces proteolyticus]KAH8704040.1 hypothetical protein BGW36DRAFT_335165 [Talaromyces proteolyticus]